MKRFVAIALILLAGCSKPPEIRHAYYYSKKGTTFAWRVYNRDEATFVWTLVYTSAVDRYAYAMRQCETEMVTLALQGRNPRSGVLCRIACGMGNSVNELVDESPEFDGAKYTIFPPTVCREIKPKPFATIAIRY